MARILVTDGMDKNAAIELKKMGHDLTERFFEPEDLKEQIKNFDGIIVRSATKITKQIIDAAKETNQLKLIIRAGVALTILMCHMRPRMVLSYAIHPPRAARP